MKKLFPILLIIFTISFQLTYSQDRFSEDEFDLYIQKAMDSLYVPGLAVGIIKDSSVVYSKGFGLINTDEDDAVDDETVFLIASCSKAFTAAAIGILVDEGKLDWDDRVIDHLPDFRLHDPYVTREMRISDLLTHRSGLATFDGDLLWYGTNYSSAEVIRRIREMPLKNSFRYKFGYSNLMFITAGEVIKAVSGKTWDDFLRKNIFAPLGMDRTTTLLKEKLEMDNIALPHLEKKPMEFINYDNSGPAASINSSVIDLLKWVQMWLSGGTINDTQILSSKSIEKLTSLQTVLNRSTPLKKHETHFRVYGMGWSMIDYAGRKIIAHSGGMPGYLARVVWVPEDNLGFVILTNDMTAVINPVEYKILDLYLNDKDEDYISKAVKRTRDYKKYQAKQKAERDSSRISDTALSLALEDYAGTYSDKMYGDAEITFEDGELTLTMLPTKELFTSKMEHWHNDTFRIKFNDPFL
ncbi:serine hydrolase, partial [Bacteroidota bacterium]